MVPTSGAHAGRSGAGVTCIHLICAAQQVIRSNGRPSESCDPARKASALLQVPDLLALFPDRAKGGRGRPSAPPRGPSLPK